MTEWIDVAKAAVEGVGLSLPIIGTLAYFHTKRGERFDRIDEAHRELKGKVSTLNTDFDGLRAQIAASDLENERRFVSRDDHTEAVKRLDESVRELTRTLLDGRSKVNSR
jgi:hypothetical protein